MTATTATHEPPSRLAITTTHHPRHAARGEQE
jgi:hypothetical protein